MTTDREPYWWERGVGLDPVSDEEIESAREGFSIDLTVGESAPVIEVHGSDQFSCLDDDERPAANEESIALAREVVRRFNGFPLLLASLKSLLRLQNQERDSVDVEKDLCAVVEKFTGG